MLSFFKLLLLSLIFIFSLIYAFFYWYSTKDSFLGWDEVHYLQASEQGFWANYTDNSSSNFLEFIELGIAKATKNTEKIEALQKQIPTEKTDLFRLRHFHPALPVYVWILFSENIRLSSFCLFLTFLGLFLYQFYTFYKENIEFAICFLSVICTSNYFLDAFFSLNFHSYFAVANLFFFIRLQFFLEKNSLKHIIFLAFSITLLILTLETHIVILLSTFFFLHLSFVKQDFKKILFWLILFVFLLNPSFFLDRWQPKIVGNVCF